MINVLRSQVKIEFKYIQEKKFKEKNISKGKFSMFLLYILAYRKVTAIKKKIISNMAITFLVRLLFGKNIYLFKFYFKYSNLSQPKCSNSYNFVILS